MKMTADAALREWINKQVGRKTQLKADLDNRQLKTEDFTLVIRKQLTGSGIVELANISTAKERGTINIDKAAFPENEVFCFDRVGIKFKDSSASTPKEEKAYSSDAQLMPPALRNGELVLSQNGGEIFRTLADDCMNSADGEFAHGRGDVKELAVPVVIEDKSNIVAIMENAQGLSFTTGVSNNAFAEFKFYGVKIKQKSKS